MKIDENRNITIDTSRDFIIQNNSGINIISDNGMKFVLPYVKIQNSNELDCKIIKK